MTDKACVAIVAGICLIAAARAEEATPDSGGGRYSFSQVAEGVLRLDSETGEVAVCRRRTVGFACQAVPEDRAVLEREIARLRRENAALKKDILARGLPLPDDVMAEPPERPAADGRAPPAADSESDVERVMALVNRVWHRLMEAIAQAQKQLPNRS